MPGDQMMDEPSARDIVHEASLESFPASDSPSWVLGRAGRPRYDVEAWLRGPIDGISDWLQPAAHALLQAYQELETAADTVPEDRLWERPGGAASVGFHLLHVVGSTDRLLTYARGEQLNDEQMAELRAESTPPDPPPGVDELLIRLDQAVDRMFDVLRETPDTALLEPRGVGRKQLPTNVLGILMHAAEHAQRHAGQAVTTAKVLANA